MKQSQWPQGHTKFVPFFVFFFSISSLFEILKLEQHKGDCLVYMYLFIGTDSQQLDKSINYQLAQSELWQKLTTRSNNNTIPSSNSSMDTGITAHPTKVPFGAVPNNNQYFNM